MAPTTAAVLGMPLMRALRERYPDVRLHMVESLSGHLTSMLNARQLDLAVLFDSHLLPSPDLKTARRWSVMPLLEEDLFFISAKRNTSSKMASSLKLSQLKQEPLILPTGPHGLRTTLDAAFARIKLVPNIVLEIDSLALLMDAVDAGLGATLQPWAAVARFPDAAERFHMALISEANVQRVNVLCSLSKDELSPVALAARVVLKECAQQLVSQGIWTGARVKPSK
jgi:LysR family tcuABC transcriptional regulator